MRSRLRARVWLLCAQRARRQGHGLSGGSWECLQQQEQLLQGSIVMALQVNPS
jgi:hypothetical protein